MTVNVGLNLLRIILTLGVVMDHFWWCPDPENLHGIDIALWQLRTLAVPAFMTMTFFFTAKRFIGGDVAWLRKRYFRLYEPFVFWTVFYYIPFDRLPAVLPKIVLFLSKYCMGVYCIHHLMGKILFDHVFHLARTETPFGAITVAPGWFWLFLWGLSYLVCYLISLVPGSFSRRIVE